MQFDVTLNLAWMVLGLFALALAIRVSFQSEARRRGQRWLRVVGVALIIVALFPYISATDDVVRIDHYATQHSKPDNTTKHTQTDNLMRLYETMDTPLICRASGIVFTFIFLSLVLTFNVFGIDRSRPFSSGRSPPFPFVTA